jgi:hypothetical protein
MEEKNVIQDDWTQREFVAKMHFGVSKIVSFLNRFEAEARFKLVMVNEQLTRLERNCDFVQAILKHSNPAGRGAKPSSIQGTVFDSDWRTREIKRKMNRQYQAQPIVKKISPSKEMKEEHHITLRAVPEMKQPISPETKEEKADIPVGQKPSVEDTKDNPDVKGQPTKTSPVESTKTPPQQVLPPPQPGAPPVKPPGPPGAPPPGPQGGPPARPPGTAPTGAPASMSQSGPPQAPPVGPPGVPSAAIPPPIPQPASDIAVPPSQPPPGPAVIPPPGPGVPPPGPALIPPPPGTGAPPACPGIPPTGPGAPPPGPGAPPVAFPGPPTRPPPKPVSADPAETVDAKYSEDEEESSFDDPPIIEFNPPIPEDHDDIWIQRVKPGNQNKPGPNPNSNLTIEYTGWIKNTGDCFDQIDDFQLQMGSGDNIEGLEKILLKMKEGENILAFIPSKKAYGEAGGGDVIPPNSDLVFDLTLVSIE